MDTENTLSQFFYFKHFTCACWG